MGAGIHQNVSLRSVTFEPMSTQPGSTSGNVLRFNFYRETDGTSFTHTEFSIDEKKLRELAKGWAKGATQQEKNAEIERIVESEYDAQTRRIEHICGAFLDGFVCPEASSWEAFSRGVIAALGDANKGVNVSIKIVLNKKDYEIFPKYVGKGFIQKSSEPLKLFIDAKYDRVVTMAPKDSATAGNFDDGDGTAAGDGAAPFIGADEEF